MSARNASGSWRVETRKGPPGPRSGLVAPLVFGLVVATGVGWVTLRHREESRVAPSLAGGTVEPAERTSLVRSPSIEQRIAERHASDDLDERVSSGLGELVARRPGKTDDKDTALRLSTHSATIRIAANVARTEVVEEFANETGDDLEGIYRFPLPPGARIQGLSLDVDGKMIPGSFVEKGKAKAIWQGAIQNAAPKEPKPKDEVFWVPGPWRDPALLEWSDGGRFELRVFPIPRHGSRRIALSYTEVVPSLREGRRYVYALPDRAGAKPIDHFAFDVEVRGAEPVRSQGYELARRPGDAGVQRLGLAAEAFTPAGDLALEYVLESDLSADVTAWAYREPLSAATPSTQGPAASSEDRDPFVAFAMRPRLPRGEPSPPRDLVLVVDSGRGMIGEAYRRASRLAVAIAGELDPGDRVHLLACDVTCRALPQGWLPPGPSSAKAALEFLSTVTPEGASDLVGATRSAAALPGRIDAHDLRVVLLSSGFASAGYRRAARVPSEVSRALADARAEVVTVPIGGDANLALLGEIARGGGGVSVPYAPGQAAADVALAVIEATHGATLRDVSLTLPEGLYGAPSELSPVRAGGEELVTMRMKGERVQGDAVLRGNVGGQPFEARYPIDVRASTEPGNAFVPRLYASARIAELERAPDDSAKPELVRLSQRYAVPSRFTSLLVLESEAMFRAFGVDRAPIAQAFTGENEANPAYARAPAPAATESATAAAPSDSHGYGAMRKALYDDEYQDLGAGRAVARPIQLRAPAPPPESVASALPALAANLAEPSLPGAAAPDSPQDIAPRRRPGRWMRREWFRGASITDPTPPASMEKIAAARAALEASPNERARHKELARLLALDGQLAELDEVIERWTARDPLDPDAVAARSDVLARRGLRDESLRVQSGLLGVRGVPARDEAALERALARAFGRAGKREACAFWIGAAELGPADVDAVAHAAACERADGRAASADAWLAALPDDATHRDRARQLSASYEPLARDGAASPETATRGDVVVEASWEGAEDLDVVIIDPAGNRQSWSGRGPSLRASDPRAKGHEEVALTSYAAGPFMVELVRRAGDSSGVPVHGKVRVRALGGDRDVGASRSRDFVLDSERVAVARVNVRWDSRLVAANGPVP